jgi:L-fuconolactonase
VSSILDAHTHFFDPSRPIPSGRSMSVPWPPVGDVLYRTTLPSEYVALAQPLGIAKTVTIEASAWLEDNQWVLNVAAMNPVITGFVGNLSEVLGAAGFSAALSSLAGNPLVRGIRVSPAQLSNANMADFALLAQMGLMIDVLGSPGDLMTVSAFAKSLPSLRIVIDHMANVQINGSAPPSNWVSGMSAAASQPNVYCKVSGLVEGSGMLGQAPTDVAFYRPTLDVLWQAFGEDRLVFASNWPVSSPYAPLSTVLGIVQAYFADKGAAANDKCFAKNAKAAYGL